MDPEPHQHEKWDPDPHQNVLLDPPHWLVDNMHASCPPVRTEDDFIATIPGLSGSAESSALS